MILIKSQLITSIIVNIFVSYWMYDNSHFPHKLLIIFLKMEDPKTCPMEQTALYHSIIVNIFVSYWMYENSHLSHKLLITFLKIEDPKTCSMKQTTLHH